MEFSSVHPKKKVLISFLCGFPVFPAFGHSLFRKLVNVVLPTPRASSDPQSWKDFEQ
jgi:hypothetical protein